VFSALNTARQLKATRQHFVEHTVAKALIPLCSRHHKVMQMDMFIGRLGHYRIAYQGIAFP
jgi:hypothetical protein